MSKSSSRRPFGRKSSTVTVIEAKVHRSAARNAQMAFWITLITVTAGSMVVASAYMHPIFAAMLGLLVGGVTAGIVWTLVRVWPVLVRIWWWALEITLAIALVDGWIQLASHTNLLVRALVVAALLGVFAIPVVRRNVVAVAWCVIVRHRLRVCFTQFIIANQSGSLPLIFLARPTPVGERVWIYLRPGLSHNDLNSRLDKIAVACHASTVLVERASDKTAGFLRIDIKRREVLTADVGSPLVDLVDPDTPATVRTPGVVPTALDLPDVADTAAAGKPAPAPRASGDKPPAASSANGAAAVEDVSDWI